MVAELEVEASRTIKGRRKFVIIFLIIGKTECQFIVQIVTNRRKFPEDSDLQTRYHDMIATGVNPGSFC